LSGDAIAQVRQGADDSPTQAQIGKNICRIAGIARNNARGPNPREQLRPGPHLAADSRSTRIQTAIPLPRGFVYIRKNLGDWTGLLIDRIQIADILE